MPAMLMKSYLPKSLVHRFEKSKSAEQRGRCMESRMFLQRILQSQQFDSLVCALVFLNAFSLGVQIDFVANNPDALMPGYLRAVETLFCAIFVIELAMRIFCYGCRFFRMRGWQWNILDVAVVLMQIFEEVSISLLESGSDMLPGTNFSVVRLLRILRLIRVVRLVRVLRAIAELRMLVLSILSSMKSLLWTVVLLFLLIYTLALYITQFVSDHHRSHAHGGVLGDDIDESLAHWYGSVGSTMLSLFQSVTGGIDWESAVRPLMDEISLSFAFLYVVYIAFCNLALLNVVTGVFVESVLKSAKTDRDFFIINGARELFQTLDGGISGLMTWKDFESKIDAPQMQEFLRAIDLDPSEAQGLFRLLDLDGSGSISAEEFLNGCLRLRGPAKALDLAVLMHEVRLMAKKIRKR